MIQNGSPDETASVAGVRGTVAVFVTDGGKIVATIDDDGNLGLLGGVIINGGNS